MSGSGEQSLVPGKPPETCLHDRGWNQARDARLFEESQLRQLAITEATSDLVATFDLDCFLLTLNAAGHRLLGLAPDCDLLQLRLPSFFAPHCVPTLFNTDLPGALEHGIWHAEAMLAGGAEGEIPVSMVLIAHRDSDDNPGFFSVILRDIRPLHSAELQRRELLEQLHQSRRMETLGRLAGNIAHDFNNLLTVIMGYAELGLAEHMEVSARREELQIILDSAQRAARLTAQLLDFSCRQRIEPQVLDINHVIRQSAELFGALLGEGIRITIEPEVPLWLTELDRSQFEQILLNLAVNARDALGDKGSFAVRTHNRNLTLAEAQASGMQQGGDFVEMQVSDTGCGIAPEHIKSIFEPFFTTKPKGMGSGMGLAAVYGVLVQNGGGIRVNSTPGLGTTFIIYLPRYAGPGR